MPNRVKIDDLIKQFKICPFIQYLHHGGWQTTDKQEILRRIIIFIQKMILRKVLSNVNKDI